MIRIVVHGLPAPQGSKRFVGTSKSGRGILIEQSAKVRPWREDVRHATVAVMQAEAARPENLLHVVNGRLWPIDAPLCVRMTFTLAKPVGAPKRRQSWPMRTPDLSKLIRSTEDAITSAGLWKDDARVVECIAAKRYPGEGADALGVPGCVIEISRLDGP